MSNLKVLFDDVNNSFKDIYGQHINSLKDLSINHHIQENKKYGGWYGDADTEVSGKNYKVSVRIPNNVIKDALSRYSDLMPATYNVEIDKVDVNAYGKLAIHVSKLSKVGSTARDELNEELYRYSKKKGYLKRKKKPLPKTITSILCITSVGSNIRGDVLNTTGLSDSKVKVLNVGSSAKIAKIILNNKYTDITVLYRGGHEDVAMDMFSDKPVLDAIAKSKKPVCVALGHDVDTPFVYQVADQTFSTPSSFGKSIAAHNKGVVYSSKIRSHQKSKILLGLIILVLVYIIFQVM